MRSKAESSGFWIHQSEVHGKDVEPRFKMKVEQSIKGNLARQSLEGRKIRAFKGEYPLNSKGEWGQNLAPKLVLEGQEGTGGKRQGGANLNPREAKRARRNLPQTEGEEKRNEDPPEKEGREAGPISGPNQDEEKKAGALTTFGHTVGGPQEHSTRPRKPLTVKQILLKMSQLREEGLNKEKGTKKDENLSNSDTPAKPDLLFLANQNNSGGDEQGMKKRA